MNNWRKVNGISEKICPLCKIWKPENDYHDDTGIGINEGAYCIECIKQKRYIIDET